MTLPLSSASQPITHPAASDGVPQASFPFDSAALLRSQSRLHDVANESGLDLPPNVLSILAHWQASGQLPPPLDDPTDTQPATAAASGATLKSTARPRSQVSKSGRSSAHARRVPVPVPTPVPQPPAAAQYQPPPLKARARRAMLAAKSKGPKAGTPAGSAAANATAGASTSRNGCTKDLSTLALQSTLPIAERARMISQFSGLGDLPVKLIEKWVERTASLAAEAQHRGQSSTRAAGDTGASGTETGDQSAHYEETSAPIMEMPEIVAAPTCQLPGSSPPTEPSEPFPTVERLAPAPTTEDPVLSELSMGFPHWWSEHDLPELVTATELSGAVEPPRELEQPPVTWEAFKNLDDWDNFFNFGGPNQV